MATYYNKDDKEQLSLVEQNAKRNVADLIIKDPTKFNTAELHTSSNTPAGFEGSSKAVYTHNDSQGSVKDQMNANSKLWWEAKAAGDTDWMKSLEAANQQLAGLLGEGVNYNPSSGTWSGVADMPATMQASMTTGVNPQLPTYESAYNAKIDQLMNEMLNREKFSYNAETDPLFQQYKNIYTREGNRSMNDTLAAAASGAGGMSSYAMTAAQQANNYYMAQLGDKVPELQQLAYEMYMNDLGQQRQDINMLLDKDSYDYSQYRDQMNDYKWGTEFNYGAYRDQVADQRYADEWAHMLEREGIEDERYNTEWEYGVSRDQIADQRYDQEWAYGLERDKISDQRYDQEWQYGLSRDQIEDMWRERQWNYNAGQDQTADERYAREEAYNRAMDMFSMGVMPDSDLLRAAGISEDKAQEILGGGSPFFPSDGISEIDPEQEANAEASKAAMGLLMVNYDTMVTLSHAGAFSVNPDGSFTWAPGWDAKNWQSKLNDMKFAPHYWG